MRYGQSKRCNGAGERENNIPYSSFGLVWNKFGEVVCGSVEIADYIDREVVQPIDANDCGVAITEDSSYGVAEYSISRIMNLFMPVDGDKNLLKASFLEAVSFATFVLKKEIKYKKHEISARQKIKEIYENTKDKRILVFEKRIPWENEVMEKYTKVLFVVYPYAPQWRVKTVRKNWSSFETRRDLPKSWAGKTGEALKEETHELSR